MGTQATVTDGSPGALLNRMLAGQRTFLENVYSLMRFLEIEIAKHGWELIKNGGYGITRNGMGRGLGNFTGGDWVINQAGIAFVRPGLSRTITGTTITEIPREGGLELLIFQVRWLEKSPQEPVVWCAKVLADVAAEGQEKARKWEEYQTVVFARLEPEARSDGTRSGDIKPGRISGGGTSIVFTGRYIEVPVAELRTQEDIVSQIIEPTIAG